MYKNDHTLEVCIDKPMRVIRYAVTVWDYPMALSKMLDDCKGLQVLIISKSQKKKKSQVCKGKNASSHSAKLFR
jgi:hypothetical protein